MDERKDRETRLAAALRENLKRRKAQARERAADDPEENDAPSPAPDNAPAAEGHGGTGPTPITGDRDPLAKP